MDLAGKFEKCHLWSAKTYPGIILCMGWANEKRRYIVTSSLIDWAHTQNGPCCSKSVMTKEILYTGTEMVSFWRNFVIGCTEVAIFRYSQWRQFFSESHFHFSLWTLIVSTVPPDGKWHHRSKVNIGPCNVLLSPVWRQAINSTNVELLLIEWFVNNFQWNVNQNNIFLQEKAFSNVVCKMSMILYQPQYGKYSPVFNVSWTSARCLHMLAQSSSHSNLTNYHNRLRSYIIN